MSDSTSAPFISEPMGSFAEDYRGPPESTTQETTELFGGSQQLLRARGRNEAIYGSFDDYGRPVSEPDVSVPADALNQKYSIPGKLNFDSPLPDSVAKSMYDTKLDEIVREEAKTRRPAGFLAGVDTYGSQFVADALDPLNIAAVFVPGVPELDLGASLAGRLAARGVAGAASGAVGMVPLAGLKYGLGRQEQSDYDAYSAISDVAMGAGLGAVLHVGGGALGDWLTSRTRQSPAWEAMQEPEVREAALKTAAAQIAEDRPVEVRPVFDQMGPGGEAPFPETAPPAARDDTFWIKDIDDVRDSLSEKPLPTGWEIGADPDSRTGWAVYDEADRKIGSAATAPEALQVARELAEGRQPEGGPPTYITEPPAAGEPGVTPKGTALVTEPREPTRLTSFLQAAGGLRDDGGEIRDIIGGVNGRPGLIRNNGMGLDEAAHLAWENGYFPENAEQRPDINQFLEALDDDAKGHNPRYSQEHEVQVAAYQDARTHNSEVLRLASETGISPEGRTTQQFYDAVAQHLTEDDLDKRIGGLIGEHETAYAEAERMAREHFEDRGEAWHAADFYGKDQTRTLEDLENEYRQEAASSSAGQRPGGGEPGGPAAGDQTAIPTGGQPGQRGAGTAGRAGPQERSQILRDALRAASGERGPTPVDAAADAAAKLKPEAQVKQAQAEIADHEEFFRQAAQATRPIDQASRAIDEVLRENGAKRISPRDFATEAATPTGSRHGIILPDGRIFEFDLEKMPDSHAEFNAEFLKRRAQLEGREFNYEAERDRGSGGIVKFNGFRDNVGMDPSTPLTAEQKAAVRAIEGTMKRAGGRVEVGEPYEAPVPEPTEADAYSGLAEDVRAELEAINNLDKEAADVGKAAMQAAGCMARGLRGA